ncbi:YceI family protein [Planctomicrobium sp. SH664]|uniref:YceI family protein n=1 Tax=Planctomicrobium sp. SH664 TaxID=3448125 RepID=UPI003F5B196D
MKLLTRVSLLALVLAAGQSAFAGEKYNIDPAHSDVSFKISHLGLARILGRFNDISGSFEVDAANPQKSSFVMTIKTDSIDTNQPKRDEHLKSPDFFNVKQYPTASFKSTSVKAVDGGLDVTGDFTLHGVTKPVTLRLQGGGAAEFPPGVQRTGYTAEFVLKRSDFGIDKFAEVVGDEVAASVSFEGTKAK